VADTMKREYGLTEIAVIAIAIILLIELIHTW
jgi:hypothetical protein